MNRGGIGHAEYQLPKFLHTYSGFPGNSFKSWMSILRKRLIQIGSAYPFQAL